MSEPKSESKSSPPTLSTVTEKGQPLIEIVAPLNIDRLAYAFKKFEDFKRRLLTRDDSIEIKGRQYLKKSAWRKWALACAVSDEILSYERVPPQGKDQDGNFSYRVVVRAFHTPTGRSSVGVAVASKAEKKEWAHEEHDIFALCHTRAKNRAIADLVGGGEVSAEEMISSEPPRESQAGEATPPPSTSTPICPGETPETWTVHVPITKDVVTIPGVKQIPLINGTTAIGMINVLADGSQASMVLEKPIPADCAPIRNFLIPRLLDAMKAKHPGFDYRLDIDQNGLLKAILIRGRLEDPQVKELSNAARWTFIHGMEKQAQPT
jgi:hypothetical protein